MVVFFASFPPLVCFSVPVQKKKYRVVVFFLKTKPFRCLSWLLKSEKKFTRKLTYAGGENRLARLRWSWIAHLCVALIFTPCASRARSNQYVLNTQPSEQLKFFGFTTSNNTMRHTTDFGTVRIKRKNVFFFFFSKSLAERARAKTTTLTWTPNLREAKCCGETAGSDALWSLSRLIGEEKSWRVEEKKTQKKVDIGAALHGGTSCCSGAYSRATKTSIPIISPKVVHVRLFCSQNSKERLQIAICCTYVSKFLNASFKGWWNVFSPRSHTHKIATHSFNFCSQ